MERSELTTFIESLTVDPKRSVQCQLLEAIICKVEELLVKDPPNVKEALEYIEETIDILKLRRYR